MCFVEISGREGWRKLHSEKLHSMQFAVSVLLLVIIEDNKIDFSKKNNFHDDGQEIDTCWQLMSAQKDTKPDYVYCD
jgi:hypothetical protein